MSDIQYSATPREILELLGIQFKVNGYWFGFRLCPFCGGGEGGRDQWTFAVHSKDGNYNCLRDKCEAKGTFWGFMQFHGLDPRQYVVKDGQRRNTKSKKSKRFVYGKR